MAEVRRLASDQNGFVGFLMENLPGLIFGAVFNTTVAVVYKLKVVNKSPKLEQRPMSSETDFQPDISACLCDRHLCCHICLLQQCRVAHTWHVAGLLNYWPAIFVQAFCGLCVGAHFRAKLKRNMGIQPNLCAECKAVCCSQLCAIG